MAIINGLGIVVSVSEIYIPTPPWNRGVDLGGWGG